MSLVDPKGELRRDILARRAARTPEQREIDGESIALHAASIPAVGAAQRVAVYLSMASEPSTRALIDLLLERRVKVIVPLVTEGRLLVWTRLGKDSAIRPGPLGVPQPEVGKVTSLDRADIVFVPALAVDHEGNRLGRGAGYFDRALAGVDAPVCAIVNADEVVESVPHQPHDIAVHMALTPQGLIRF